MRIRLQSVFSPLPAFGPLNKRLLPHCAEARAKPLSPFGEDRFDVYFSSRESASAIAARREKIKRLYRQGKTDEWNAKRLKITAAVLKMDLFVLRKQPDCPGNLAFKNRQDPVVAARRERVKRDYRQDETDEQNAERMGIDVDTLKKDVQYFRRQPNCPKNLQLKRDKRVIAARREKIKRGYRQDKTDEWNAQRLKIGVGVLRHDLAYLREQPDCPKNLRKKYETVPSK